MWTAYVHGKETIAYWVHAIFQVPNLTLTTTVWDENGYPILQMTNVRLREDDHLTQSKHTLELENECFFVLLNCFLQYWQFSYFFSILTVLGFSREKTNRIYIIYIYVYIIYMRRFLIGNGSCGFGGQEVPQSALCKLGTQESQWCNLVWIRSPENWGTVGVSVHLGPNAPQLGALMFKHRRRWMSQLK